MDTTSRRTKIKFIYSALFILYIQKGPWLRKNYIELFCDTDKVFSILQLKTIRDMIHESAFLFNYVSVVKRKIYKHFKKCTIINFGALIIKMQICTSLQENIWLTEFCFRQAKITCNYFSLTFTVPLGLELHLWTCCV